MKRSIIESIKYLCVKDFSDEDLTAEQKKLHTAVKSFLNSDEKETELLLRELLSGCCTDEEKDIALDLLFSLLVWQDRFDELHALGLPRNNADAEQIAMYDARNTEFLLSSEFVVNDMPDFPWLQPLMTIQINGENNNLLIDTGALATVVTESVAKRCGLAVEENTVEAEAATEGSVVMQTARIGKLKIGASLIKNKRCMIVPDEAFDFSVIGGPKIDGLIGWEIIKCLYWEIDYPNRKVGVRASTKERVERNMCCDFFPMLQASIGEDETIVVGFDTGAVTTTFGKGMVGRFPGAKKGEREMMGVGQAVPSNYSGYTVPNLPMKIENSQVSLQDAFVLSDDEYSKGRTLIQAGALGSDAVMEKVLVIDYQNRHLGIK